ncbi:2-methylcitrate dehydratase PrpD [Variovorax sp. CF079]|uniref:MmgE/PrpD family protein n=1 Tax=Variovorax sp. CF079 TaxID=1882774 RepID=UPI00088795C8|nr:MmgE/PrpD family protein [Variovorax sp. CF079]SDE79677.1 2-methylcitrate dehydratase PrpD [Variovorax sp. CF079]
MTATAHHSLETPPTQPDLVLDLASFAANIDTARLDRSVVEAVKTNILDTLSCALAGSSAKAIAEVSGLVQEWAGTPQADMFVFGGKFPAHHAALINGGMSHARDYDDTHDAAILHAGVTAVPAAIAAAQLRGGVSGSELIAAVAAGLEVTCRLGVGVKVDIVESGFIYTSLLGYFGATAAAGRALGLNDEQMRNAFGIVYSSVAGNHQVTRDASLMKRLQPGLAAQAAVLAVQLAQRGIRGAQEVFDGADGFIRVYLQGRVDREVVRKDLGQRFELLSLSYKPYPCCRDTHSAIDAALELRAQTGRPASDIETIRVGVTAPGYQMVCVPEAVRLAPRTIVEAQFSIPYTVAAAWIDGRMGIGHFSDEGLQRKDILALTARVRPYVDADIERDWSRFVTPARVVVEFRDGQTVETRIDYPKGHPRNPMLPAEFTAKTADCATFAARALPADTAARLTETVGRLESVADIAELMRTIT